MLEWSRAERAASNFILRKEHKKHAGTCLDRGVSPNGSCGLNYIVRPPIRNGEPQEAQL